MLLSRELWDRTNALDSASFRAATIAGPAIAGTLVAAFGSSRTMTAIGLTWIAAGLLLWPVAEPRGAVDRGRGVVSEAVAGMGHVLRSRVLRRLAIVFPAGTLSAGALGVLPVLVLTRLQGSPAQVGLLWAAMGAGGLVANLLMGGVRTEGRENRIMAAGFTGFALSLVLVALAPTVPVAAAGMALAGLCSGPIDNAMFGLRVRALEPAWFGRSMSISMALNSLGFPLGAGLGGPLVGFSLPLALWFVCLGSLAGGALSLLLLRPPSQPAPLPVLQSVGSPKP